MLIFFVISHNEIICWITDIDDCLSDPCKNNGTCTDMVNDYQCGCVAGFNGRTCENSKPFKYVLITCTICNKSFNYKKKNNVEQEFL